MKIFVKKNKGTHNLLWSKREKVQSLQKKKKREKVQVELGWSENGRKEGEDASLRCNTGLC